MSTQELTEATFDQTLLVPIARARALYMDEIREQIAESQADANSTATTAAP